MALAYDWVHALFTAWLLHPCSYVCMAAPHSVLCCYIACMHHWPHAGSTMALCLPNWIILLTDLVHNATIAEVGTIAWEYRQPFHTLSILWKVEITNTTSLILNTLNLHSLFFVKTLGLVCIPNDHKQHLIGHCQHEVSCMPMCSDKSSVHDQQHTLRGAGKHMIGN